ncbi:MAG: DDE-type integrase/transposase/recombinase [Bacteroidetes bacterium]|nr:DDE-type integrase/transposase/recombinase [Bacteroidota bacterium]MDA0943187.1 DDE-type integrase/transposase/recombinase [Bacteroidota bacterium]
MKHGNSKYPLELMLAVSTRKEKEFYPEEFLRTIPRSTLSLWRSKPPHFFIQQFENPENVAAVQRLLNRDSHEVEMRKRITDSYFKFLQFIKKQMGDKDYLNFLSSNKREFIKVVDSLDGAISQNIFLEAAGISKNRYWTWQVEEKVKCSSSYDSVCIRRRPHKTALAEVRAIRRIARNGGPNKYAIWANAIKQGKIAVGKQTFYTYTKDILTEKQRPKKQVPRVKVRATAVNQIWHADISVIRCLNGKKYYLYCVIDNYSRAILAWRLANKIRKEISFRVLKKAHAIATPEKLNYMTDGGSENRGILLPNFWGIRFNVVHWVAGKNGHPSNSMIERVFHTLKNEYKRVLEAQNSTHLKTVVHEVIEAYMDRPHSAHGVYSPREVLMNQTGWFDQKTTLELAYKKRLMSNRKASCKNCQNCSCLSEYEWDSVGQFRCGQ